MSWVGWFLLYVAACIVVVGVYGIRQFHRRGDRLVYIHDRLDSLDPGVRALSPEEEVERLALMKELEEMS